jgi:hypothetical protein
MCAAKIGFCAEGDVFKNHKIFILYIANLCIAAACKLSFKGVLKEAKRGRRSSYCLSDNNPPRCTPS